MGVIIHFPHTRTHTCETYLWKQSLATRAGNSSVVQVYATTRISNTFMRTIWQQSGTWASSLLEVLLSKKSSSFLCASINSPKGAVLHTLRQLISAWIGIGCTDVNVQRWQQVWLPHRHQRVVKVVPLMGKPVLKLGKPYKSKYECFYHFITFSKPEIRLNALSWLNVSYKRVLQDRFMTISQIRNWGPVKESINETPAAHTPPLFSRFPYIFNILILLVIQKVLRISLHRQTTK